MLQNFESKLEVIDEDPLNENDESENWTPEKILKLIKTEGRLPSPIDLHVANTTRIELSCLTWMNYEKLPKKMKIYNSGKTLVLSFKWNLERPYLFGGFLKDKYVISQIHFHWGREAYNGSEHTVEGKSYPLELHAVHFKLNYRTFENALKHDDGLLTLVYFYEIKSQHNPTMQNLLSKISEIRYSDSSIPIEPFNLTELIFPFEKDYYFYFGTIITNSEHYIMTWMISRDIGYISVEQMKQFHLLLDRKLRPIYSNNRSKCALFNRKIFHVNPNHEYTNSTLSTIPLRYDGSMNC